MKINKKLIWPIGVIILFTILLSISEATNPQAAGTLSVQAIPKQVGPQVVAQNPIAGQRLDLSPTIQITFDRDMERVKTSNAFSLLGPDQKPVAGKVTWLDARTFEFAPDAKLEPASTYRGIFSTSAAALDGTSPTDVIEVDFTTTESLEVGQVFPSADAEDIDQKTNITVIFNHPIVPLTIKEEQADLPQPLELSPQVAGQGQWVNSSVYVFQPDQALLSGTRYTVRVGAGLKDTNGDALDKSFVWQFSTRVPGIASVALKNGPENPQLDNIQNVLLDQAFIITFLQPMNPDSVASATTVTNRETKTPAHLDLSWNKDFTVLTIQPHGQYDIASYYDLQIADTAQAADGGTLKDGLTAHFSTVPLPQVVKINPPNTKGGFDGSLSIQFASPMKLDSLKSRIIITPAPKTAPQWYYNDYDYSYNMYGLDPGANYIVRALPGMADIYGNTIKTESSLSFNTADLSPYARLVMPWTPLVYRAQGPQDVFFEYTNLDSATLSLYPLAFDEFKGLVGGPGGDKGSVASTTFMPQAQPINEWKPDTQATRNQVHSLNIKLEDQKGNSLPPGYYFVGVKGSPLDYKGNFYQAFIFIVATDNITFKSTSNEGLAWVVDLESGKPQANVPVMFYDKDMKQVGSTTNTDSNGLVYLNAINSPMFARVEGSGHLAFVAQNWGSGVWAGDLGIQQNYYGPTSAPFVYLYTYRPVYRPGQDVYFKGLVRQNDDLHYSLVKDTQV